MVNRVHKPHFIEAEIEADIAAERYSRPISTRFPPEPGGYAHLGHAKAATISFDLAERYDGHFILRLDDTNPLISRQEYVDAMIRDIGWLFGPRATADVRYASDYFASLIESARLLVEQGDAYVDALSYDEIRDYRGDYYRAGRPSPFRDRDRDENLAEFDRMVDGGFAPGERVLRAKIDYNAANMNLRDPLIYRSLDAPHYRVPGYSVYPLYDFAHPLSDAIEGITHSTCGLEFADHRPLYDWYLERLGVVEPPRQIEFGEVAIERSVLSKRAMRELVDHGCASGWDDPRLPTLAGLRRLGYPPDAVVEFARELGVANSSGGVASRALLTHHVRRLLNETAERYMGVRSPIRLSIDGVPDRLGEGITIERVPGQPESGTRVIPFSADLFIDESDFREDPPKDYYRLAPGRTVRLRGAGLVRCIDFSRDPATGAVDEVMAVWDGPVDANRASDGSKVRGTLHWVAQATAVPAEFREFGDLLEAAPEPEQDGGSILDRFSPESLRVFPDARVEPALASLAPGTVVQLERVGFFSIDPESRPGHPVLNLTASLRDNKFRRIFSQPESSST